MTAAPITSEAGAGNLPALTSVRFFLALGVVLFHLQLTWSWPTVEHTGLIERARLGVDAFFLLSGFVLTHVYAAQVETGVYSHRRFLVARLARIYPAHGAMLLLMAAVAAFAVVLGETFDPVLYSPAGFLQTLLLVHAWGANPTPIEWNGPSWSLSAEWGAYLLFPVFAWIGLKLRHRPLVLAGLAVAVFAALDGAYRAVLDAPLLHAEFRMGVLRILPTFLGGVALYWLYRRIALTPGRARTAAVAAALGLLLAMHLRLDEPVVVLGSAALVLALALLSKAGADGPLASAPLLFLGEASYAIYLAHMPAIVVWKNARAALSGGGSDYVIPMGEAALLTLAIIVAGSLVHVFFERPARVWIRRKFLGPAPRAVPSAT